MTVDVRGHVVSIGDSALRSGLVDYAALTAAVASLRRPGARRAGDRLPLLDARAANAFESCCRAVLLGAGIDGFLPQVVIRHHGRWIGRVDLVDRRRRIVVECDGHDTHGGRTAFVADLVRFTSLVAAGWRPLRFTWEQVMFRPEWVLEMVRDTVDGARPEDRRIPARQRAAA
jgi:very-short-patch-repair endonuclease